MIPNKHWLLCYKNLLQLAKFPSLGIYIQNQKFFSIFKDIKRADSLKNATSKSSFVNLLPVQGRNSVLICYLLKEEILLQWQSPKHENTRTWLFLTSGKQYSSFIMNKKAPLENKRCNPRANIPFIRFHYWYNKFSNPSSLPATEFAGLPVPLLDTGLGNLKAPVNSTQPGECCFLQVGPVVVVSNLHVTAVSNIHHYSSSKWLKSYLKTLN